MVTLLVLLLAVLGTGVLLPLPEDVVIVLAGAGVGEGTVDLVTSTVGCVLGAWLGDALLFAAGTFFSTGLTRLPRVRRLLSRIDTDSSRWLRARALLERHGDLAYLVARVVPGVRGAVFFGAGLGGRSPSRFAIIDAMATLVHVPLLLVAGALLGPRALALVTTLDRVGTAVVALATATALVLVVLRFRASRSVSSGSASSSRAR